MTRQDRRNRRALILSLRKANPTMTLAGIASATGVSRQWVYRILADSGQPTRRACGTARPSHPCVVCGQIARRKGQHCRLHLPTQEMIVLQCDACGTLVLRAKRYLTRGYSFVACGPVCRGKITARRTGSGPTNLRTYVSQLVSRTHCARGHPYTADNVRIINSRWRRCLTCARLNRVARSARDYQEPFKPLSYGNVNFVQQPVSILGLRTQWRTQDGEKRP